MATAASGPWTARQVALFARRQIERDMVLRTFTRDLRFSFVQCTALVNDARRRFDVVDAPSMELYAKTLTASMLLASMLKGEERYILDFRSPSGSPIERIYGEALSVGEVRGFIAGPQTKRRPTASTSPTTRLAAGSVLRASKILANASSPFASAVEATVGTVDGDVQALLDLSDQVPSFCHIEVAFRDPTRPADREPTLLREGRSDVAVAGPDSLLRTEAPDGAAEVAFCGGLLVQKLPGGAPDALERFRRIFTEGLSRDEREHARRVLARAPAWESLVALSARGDGAAATASPARPATPPSASTAELSAPMEAWVTGVPFRIEPVAHLRVTPQDLTKILLPEHAERDMMDREVFASLPVHFFCRCSKEKFVTNLARVPRADLEDIRDRLRSSAGSDAATSASSSTHSHASPGEAMVCQFCNASYPIELPDVEAMLRGDVPPTLAAAAAAATTTIATGTSAVGGGGGGGTSAPVAGGARVVRLGAPTGTAASGSTRSMHTMASADRAVQSVFGRALGLTPGARVHAVAITAPADPASLPSTGASETAAALATASAAEMAAALASIMGSPSSAPPDA